MTFKVGDRVAAYTPYRRTGTVSKIERGYLQIDMDDALVVKTLGPVHPKQCRKLVKKERRRIWVRKSVLPEISLVVENQLAVSCVDRMSDPAWIEFIEVKKK